jgi:membrane associated rhomboid family serine protease
MSLFSTDNDHQPLLYVRGHGLFATHVLVGVFVISMILTALLSGLRVDAWFAWLPFESERVLRGEFWRVLTYGLVNPPSISFAISMVMMVWFGREVEKFLGWRTFLKLYSGIYLLPPVLFTLIGLARPSAFAGEIGSLAVFVAFATLYPNAVLLFNLLAKWVALILVAIYALIAISNRSLEGLVMLAATSGFAWLFIRHEQGHFQLPRLRLPQARTRAPAPTARGPARAKPPAAGPDFMAEADALLDKIARDGIDSLTTDERRRLDAARERLRQRGRG